MYICIHTYVCMYICLEGPVSSMYACYTQAVSMLSTKRRSMEASLLCLQACIYIGNTGMYVRFYAHDFT
jgi:hypothetical protein